MTDEPELEEKKREKPADMKADESLSGWRLELKRLVDETLKECKEKPAHAKN